jgi:SAM-dependent methyltransferase
MKDECTDWNAYLRKHLNGLSSYTDFSLIRPYLKGRILDIGCSYGSFLSQCASSTQCELVGIDPSEEALAIARESLPRAELRWGMAEHIPYDDNSFDVVTSFEVIEHIMEPDRLFQEAWRVLRTGGYLILQTPNYPIKRVYDVLYWIKGDRRDPYDDPTHLSPHGFKLLRQRAESAGFIIERQVGRNILGERRFSVLRKWKEGFLAPLFVQKMILIARKPEKLAPSVGEAKTNGAN